MTLNQIILKNLQSNIRRHVVFFLCNSLSIALFFIYTVIYLNPQINRNISLSLKDMLTAILIAIVFFVACFFNYAYTMLLKSRNSEFGLLLCLGMRKKEIKKIIAIENTLITSLSSILGLLVGTLFSRLFFLGTVKILGTQNIDYQITLNNYLLTFFLFQAIFVITIAIKNRIIKHFDVIELIASDKISEKTYLNHPLLGLLGIISLLIAYRIVYADAMHFYRVPEKSTYFTLLYLTGLYLVISQLGGLILIFCRHLRNFYIENLLVMTEMNHKLSRNKDMMYIVTVLVSILLFFLGFSKSKYVISEVKEGNFLIFISSFMAVLFFVSAVSIICFKLFSELEEERSRYNKLNCIGITRNEVKKYIGFELCLLLFFPILAAVITVFPYMAIEYLNSPFRSQILGSLLVIFIIFSVFQIIFYLIIRRKYITAILI